jgi:hypothetical protein
VFTVPIGNGEGVELTVMVGQAVVAFKVTEAEPPVLVKLSIAVRALAGAVELKVTITVAEAPEVSTVGDNVPKVKLAAFAPLSVG